MSGVAPLPTSAFGIDYHPPSAGDLDVQAVSVNRLGLACKGSDLDTLCDVLGELTVLVNEPPDSLPREDLSYYKTCLRTFSYEWVERYYGGDPQTVAESDYAEMSLEDDPYVHLKEEYEEMPQEVQWAVRQYQERLEKEISRLQGAVSESSQINDAASNHPNEPQPSANSSCGSSSGQNEVPHAPVDGEPASAEQVQADQDVHDAQQQLRNQAPNLEPVDHPPLVTCETLPCPGYPDGNGAFWFCDQLVTGVRPDNEMIDDPSTWKGDAYGGGQLGYAAWGNHVTVVFGTGQKGATEGAKATMTVMGNTVAGVGIALGLGDLALCYKRWRKTKKRVKFLEEFLQRYAAKPPTTNLEKFEKKIAEYALKKKKLKGTRTKVAAGITVIGIVGGAAGVVIGAAMASNPIGWVIALGLGLPAVFGGLGVYAYKRWRKRKRTKRADLRRAHLMQCLFQGEGNCRLQANRVYRRIDDSHREEPSPRPPVVSLNPRTGVREVRRIKDTPENRKKVDKKLKGYTRMQEGNQRQEMASAIVGMFVEEIHALDVEERRNLNLENDEVTPEQIANCFAGAMLIGLNMKPKPVTMIKELLAAFDADGNDRRGPKSKKLAEKWIQKVMGKLASW